MSLTVHKIAIFSLKEVKEIGLLDRQRETFIHLEVIQYSNCLLRVTKPMKEGCYLEES
jgi:hypothetical protein